MYENDRLYFTDDPALKALACYSTLAHWRSEGRGPAFIKVGAKVAYRGSALNRWLEARTVQPATA